VASVAEVDRVAGEMPDRLRVGVLLAAWCQMRRGEMLALQRCHVDLLHGTIRIEQAWVVPPKGRPVVGPKTEAGRRTVAVPPNILPAVEEHLEQFVGPEPKAWLFGTSTGTAISPRNFQRYCDKARDAIGRPDLHLHDLRHTGLTWATHLFGVAEYWSRSRAFLLSCSRRMASGQGSFAPPRPLLVDDLLLVHDLLRRPTRPSLPRRLLSVAHGQATQGTASLAAEAASPGTASPICAGATGRRRCMATLAPVTTKATVEIPTTTQRALVMPGRS
jgi:integrase